MKPIGGRGKKAPYQTIQMRVPLPLKRQFEVEIEGYRAVVLADSKPEYEFNQDVDKLQIQPSLIKSAIEEILADPVVTRNGKDRGACKRALDALLQRLTQA